MSNARRVLQFGCNSCNILRTVELLRIFFASVAGKATRTQGALRREGGPDCVLCRKQKFALRSP